LWFLVLRVPCRFFAHFISSMYWNTFDLSSWIASSADPIRRRFRELADASAGMLPMQSDQRIRLDGYDMPGWPWLKSFPFPFSTMMARPSLRSAAWRGLFTLDPFFCCGVGSTIEYICTFFFNLNGVSRNSIHDLREWIRSRCSVTFSIHDLREWIRSRCSVTFSIFLFLSGAILL
jgi:hypothetical protein